MKKDILAFLYVIRGEGHRSRLGRPGGGGRSWESALGGMRRSLPRDTTDDERSSMGF